MQILTFYKKHPRHVFFIVLILFLAATLFRFYPGYDWGPHKVQDGETLSGVLVRALDGNTFLAFAALNNMRRTFDVDMIWRNVGSPLEGGDIVSLRNNEIIITKPSDTEFRASLFPAKAYQKRLAQVAFYNTFIIGLAVMTIILIVKHASGEFRSRAPVSAFSVRVAQFLLAWASLPFLGVLILMLIFFFISVEVLIFDFSATILRLYRQSIENLILIVFVCLGLVIVYFVLKGARRLYKSYTGNYSLKPFFLAATVAGFSGVLCFEITYFIARMFFYA